MRVLQFLKTSVGATWALRQMTKLVDFGLDVHVALPAGGPLVDLYRSHGVTTHLFNADLPVRHPWSLQSHAREVRRIVEEVAPDVIHSHFVGTTLSLRFALGRNHPIPRVFQVPGPLHLEHAFFRTLDVFSAGQSDYWLASCRWTQAEYESIGIPSKRLGISYYSLDRTFGSGSRKGRLREELNLSPHSRIVGMVAYMYPPKRYLGQMRGLKGHEDFFDALAPLLRSDPDLVGVVIGGEWGGGSSYERSLTERGRALCGSRLHFLGTRNDVSELYPDLDLVVHPSHSENLGGALESLTLGVPTIATRVGGFPDLVIDGETGWLVEPRSPQALSEAIKTALSDSTLRLRLASNGQVHAKRLVDLDEAANQVVEMYERMLSNRFVATAT